MNRSVLAAIALVLAVSSLAVAQPPAGEVFATPSGPAQDPLWVNAEALLWWIKSNPVPVPLVTRGSTTDAQPGAIGQPVTVVLFGNENVNMDMFTGARFTAGYWLDFENVFGVEGNYFFLAGRTDSRTVSSDGSTGSQVLTNPFFNTATGREDSSLIAFPGLLSGDATISLYSFLEGAEINALYNFVTGPTGRVGLLAGFRFLDLHERLSLASNSTGVVGGPFNGFSVSQNDVFETRNLFYGGQVGLQGEWRSGQFFVDGVAKVAIGCMHQTEDISGAPGALLHVPPPPPPPPVLDDGEVYATTSNSGHHTHQRFGCVGEFDITFGYQLTQRFRLFTGYSLLLVSEVIRPGDQIDRAINPTQFNGPLVGPARPQVLFNESVFWAQGINFGFEFTF